MPFQEIRGLRLYYEVHGDGKDTIVLMHHGFGCVKIFKAVYPKLMAAGFKVVMFDRRGFGQSEAGDGFQEFYENDARYRPESVAEFRELKDMLGIERFHLVGQCEGGVIAVDYASLYPEEVITVTAASTQCFSEKSMAEVNGDKLVNKFSHLEPGLQLKMIDWHGEHAQRRYDQFAKYGGAYGVNSFDLRPVLRDVLCPALVLYPDRSAIFDVEQAVTFYRHLPKGELAVFPRCGHNTYERRPEEYAATILEFIRRNQPGNERQEAPAVTCLA